jgi:ABC-type transport system involved in multi-copper enzyme maturation permease subunit
MNELKRSFITELLKLKHLSIVWITFVAFAMIPIMGGVIMFLIQNPELIPKSSILSIKISMLSTPVNWGSYFSLYLTQGAGVAGIIGFGFVASYLFGREYSDHTYRDLLSLPISRTKILNAKFIIYIIWCLSLAISDLILGFIVGRILNLPGWEYNVIFEIIKIYFITILLTMVLGTWVSFFALWAKGYLAPLGFLIMILILAQFIPYMGWGHYLPWSIPGIYCGAAGEEFKNRINEWSYFSLIFTSFTGYLLSIAWWKYSDQT